MGAVLVVVVDVFAEQLFKLALAPDDGSVQEFVGQGASHRSAKALALCDRGGARRAVIPNPARTVSNERVNCPAPSRIRNLNRWCLHGCIACYSITYIAFVWV